MSEQPSFGINPARRCGFALDASGSTFCCRPAVYQRELPGAPIALALCAEHAAPGDRVLDPDAPYRRVSVTFEVLLAAPTAETRAAHTEAVDRVRAAVEAAGGVPSLVTVTSVVGRPGAQRGASIVPSGGGVA